MLLPEGRQDIHLSSDALAYPGIALLRISGPGGAWNARLVHGKGSVTSDALQAVTSAIAARIAASSALLVSYPGFVTQSVSIPTDSSKWGNLAVTLTHDPLEAVRYSFDPGPFWSPFSLTLSTTVVNGVIRYTTDGSAPTNLSTGYASPLSISTDTLIRAQVYQSGTAQGSVQDLAYWKQALALDKSSGAYPGFVHVTATNLNGDERYSLDGSVPTMSSPLWDGKLGLDIYKDAFFVLRTFQPHRTPAAAEYTIIDVTDNSLVPTTTTTRYFFDTTAVTLKVADKWAGADIHYTTDGTTPTLNSPLYTGAFGIWKTCTVKAIAHSTGYISPVVSLDFTQRTPTPAPVFDTTITPTFTDSVYVALYADAGLAIRYTMDGSAPTASSPLYTGPFWLKSTATVKAFCGSRNPSSIVSRTYTLDGTPRIAPDSGLLANQTSVTVTMKSTSSEIRYTTDGTDPTQLSPGYNGPIALTTFPVTLKARAFWPQAAPSSVSSVTYTKTADGITAFNGKVSFTPVIHYLDKEFNDSRDGKWYRKVTIGTQTWMAENLNYKPSGTDSGHCAYDIADSCLKYGRLYTWNETKTSGYSNMVNTGICPSGWHVPSIAEWRALMRYADSATSGTVLKSTSGWYSNGNGTDDYQFSALPAPNGMDNGRGFSGGHYGAWWSSIKYPSQNNYDLRYAFVVSYDHAYAFESILDASTRLSLRCLQDAE